MSIAGGGGETAGGTPSHSGGISRRNCGARTRLEKEKEGRPEQEFADDVTEASSKSSPWNGGGDAPRTMGSISKGMRKERRTRGGGGKKMASAKI